MKPRSSVISVLACLIILFACFTQIGATAYIGNVNPTLAKSSRYESNYVVERFNSTHYQATSGTSGTVDCGPIPNATTVINYALSHLTVGRTSKEKVLLRGDFIDCSPFLIPSYTSLEIQGSIKSLANIKGPTFVGSNNTAYVELSGGKIDGNYMHQTNNMDTILFYGVKNFSIHDINVWGGFRKAPLNSNTHGEGICLWDCDYGIVTNNQCVNASYDNIKVRGGSTYIDVTNNICKGSINRYGIQISTDGTAKVNVLGNVIDGGGLHVDAGDVVNFIGNWVRSADMGLGINEGVSQITARSNQFYITGGSAADGVRIYAASPASARPSRNTIDSNDFFLTWGATAIRVINGDYTTITNNNIQASVATGWVGVNISSAYTNGNVVVGNYFWNSTKGTYYVNTGANSLISSNVYNGAYGKGGFGVTHFEGGTSTNLGTSGTEYFYPCAMSSPGTSSYLYRAQVMPASGTIKTCYAYLSTACGSGGNRTFTLQVNGVSKAITFFASGATPSFSDLTHVVSVVAGNLLSWIEVIGGTPTAGQITVSLLFYPTDIPS